MFYVYHGGKCCGIRTIYGFGHNPDKKLLALPEVTHECIKTEPLKYANRAMHKARPEETALERFNAYIALHKNTVGEGILEVVVAVGNFERQECWIPILLKNKFKLVSHSYNMNSFNRVFVFHLVRDKKNSPVLIEGRQAIVDTALASLAK